MTSQAHGREDRIRRTIYFSGQVQGVGFRYTAESIAQRHDVTGFVCNLRDGRVELVAEGARNEVDRFQNAVEEAMHGCIREVDTRTTEPTGEFSSFRIAM